MLHRKVKANQEKGGATCLMQRTLCNLGLSHAVAGRCWLAAAAQTGGYGATNARGNSDMNQNATKLTTSERTFVKNAAEGGRAEIELGKLAAERASSSDVKQFGQRMVDDHTKANDQLKQVASEESITLPEKLDAKDAATCQVRTSIMPTCWTWSGTIRRMWLRSAPKRRPQKILRSRTSLHKHCQHWKSI